MDVSIDITYTEMEPIHRPPFLDKFRRSCIPCISKHRIELVVRPCQVPYSLDVLADTMVKTCTRRILTRRTTPATLFAGDHELGLAVLVLCIVSLAKPAFLLAPWFSPPSVWFREPRNLGLGDRQISRGWLGCERITPRSLVILQGFLGVMPLVGRDKIVVEDGGTELLMI